MVQEESKKITHVSIIMDGNGRWAQERGMRRSNGHIEGVNSVRACTEEAVRQGIKYLSLFAFSEENWGRPQEEVDLLMQLMMKSISDEVGTLMENSVRFVVLGNRERLSPALEEAIEQLEKLTANNIKLTLIVFLSYSGKWDIAQAASRMASDIAAGKAPGELKLEDYLVTTGIPDPDLIIRTSGEQRISNFLLWQAAYSEFYFTPVLWPDFREEEFKNALKEYLLRDRRYGKVK